MTEDELHRRWMAGASYDDLAAATGATRGAMARVIRRLRTKQGAERWPMRESPIKPRPDKPEKPKRAGASTLPPLDSLR